MTPDDLRAIMNYLRQCVYLSEKCTDEYIELMFNTPTLDDMVAAGLDPQGSEQILGAPWWDEMVEDVVETAEMCDADDPPDQVLEFARDVVSEYIRKRAEI